MTWLPQCSPDYGANQHSKGGCVIGIPSRGSTHAAHLTARIKRDLPDIATRMAAGEFRSMLAAAALVTCRNYSGANRLIAG